MMKSDVCAYVELKSFPHHHKDRGSEVVISLNFVPDGIDDHLYVTAVLPSRLSSGESAIVGPVVSLEEFANALDEIAAAVRNWMKEENSNA